MTTTFEAVIFDLDGVLTDTAKYHYLAWKKIADEQEIYFDLAINERLKGIDRLNSLEIILEKAQCVYSAAEKEQLISVKNDYYRSLIQDMSPQDLLPGVLEALKQIKDAGLKVGLASVSKNAFFVIDRLEIGAYFDYMADASKIKKGKPDPEIFLNVAENLNVKSANCIGVEDAAAGVKAIKAAGMYAIGIGDSQILREADEVLPDLDVFEINKYMP